MKKIILFLTIGLLISCAKEKQNPYIGNWYFDTIVDYDTIKNHMGKNFIEFEYAPYYNFSIENDSVLNFKSGFYRSVIKEHRTSYYLGTTTKYIIKDSSIIYFDKSEKDWDTVRVKKIKENTMIVSGYGNTSFKLIKKKNNYFNTNNYDAIVVNRSPCGGSCPFNSTYINRKGEFYFKGYEYNTLNDNFFSKLDKATTDKFFSQFDSIDISKLKDNYFIGATDSQTNVISFVKNGKIVKTINSYIKCPIDLQRAFTELSYAYQQVKVAKDNRFFFKDFVSFSSFVSKDKNLRIKDSEGFYLELLLHNGKKSNATFEENYELNFFEFVEKSGIKKITTDGRFYKFLNNDNTSFVIDIGSNFIDSNPILKTERED